jgi:hypothetical protein
LYFYWDNTTGQLPNTADTLEIQYQKIFAAQCSITSQQMGFLDHNGKY